MNVRISMGCSLTCRPSLQPCEHDSGSLRLKVEPAADASAVRPSGPRAWPALNLSGFTCTQPVLPEQRPLLTVTCSRLPTQDTTNAAAGRPCRLVTHAQAYCTRAVGEHLGQRLPCTQLHLLCAADGQVLEQISHINGDWLAEAACSLVDLRLAQLSLGSLIQIWSGALVPMCRGL